MRDANAGSGWNEEVGVAGSPIVFHTLANERLTDMRHESFFCDVNADRIKELQKKLERLNYQNSYCLLGDNDDALDVFEERIRQTERKPHYAVGSVIADPNGYWYRNLKGVGAPVRALTGFAIRFPRIDIILNLNMRIYRLQRALNHGVIPPIDVFLSLKKSHWLVRRTACGGDDFLLAVGRNVATGDHKALGFHDVSGDAGRRIIHIAEFGLGEEKRKESARQGSLFNEAV